MKLSKVIALVGYCKALVILTVFSFHKIFKNMFKMLIGAHSIFFQLCSTCVMNIRKRQFGNSAKDI